MRDYLTTAQVAEALGVVRQRVHQLARARGIEPVMRHPVCLWPRSAVRALKPRSGPGRPRKKKR